MSFRVRQVFGHASFQGLPVNGLRKFGVPPGGAFDQESLALVNALMGNTPDTPAIELAMGSLELECLNACHVAVVGAKSNVTVDQWIAPCPASFAVTEGTTLRIVVGSDGIRTYISIPENSEVHRWGTRLAVSSIIPGAPFRGSQKIGTTQPSSLEGSILRVLPCGARAMPSMFAKVSKDLDRVGIRLEGIQLDPGDEKLSEPASLGTIQVMNDGNLVILGPDGPTIGGYRKVAVVCSADTDKLAQLRPGQDVTLETITQQQARDAWRERQRDLEARLQHLASKSQRLGMHYHQRS